jgi:uncharacterized protein (DUF2062 family)
MISKYKISQMLKNTKEYLISSSESNFRLSVAVSVGVFSGVIPIWGFQTILTILLSFVFRLNKIIMITVSNFSQPPITPFIILGSFLLGGLFLNTDTVMFVTTSNANYELIKNNVLQYVLGSIVLAILLAVLSGITTYYFLQLIRGNKNDKN